MKYIPVFMWRWNSVL